MGEGVFIFPGDFYMYLSTNMQVFFFFFVNHYGTPSFTPEYYVPAPTSSSNTYSIIVILTLSALMFTQ